METETKKCPFCGDTILAVAVKCRYCGSDLGEVRRDKKVKRSGVSGILRGLFLVIIMLIGLMFLLGECRNPSSSSPESSPDCLSDITIITDLVEPSLSVSVVPSTMAVVIRNSKGQSMGANIQDSTTESGQPLRLFSAFNIPADSYSITITYDDVVVYNDTLSVDAYNAPLLTVVCR